MIADGIFALGERGLHVLFDTSTIEAAFESDAAALRRVVLARRGELETVLSAILCAPDASLARTLVADLDTPLRHVLVHLYFEILEGRIRRRSGSVH
jgi:hypothetical protein